MSVPPRTSICLHCRTALFADESCDASPDHLVARMDEIYGRECLVAAVWGPPRVRLEQLHAKRRINRALGGFAAFGAVAGMLASTVVFPVISASTALLSGALSGGVFWTFGKRAIDGAELSYPIGAESLPAPVAGYRGQCGVLKGSAHLQSPASSSTCVAYALELHFDDEHGPRVMYRDAVCTELELKLGDEQVVRIPAGRIRFFGPKKQEIDLDNVHLDAYVSAFDPKRLPAYAFDPLRYNVVYEQLLFDGDHVELCNKLRPTIDRQAPPLHYRESMPSFLAPDGIPRIRPLDRTSRGRE